MRRGCLSFAIVSLAVASPPAAAQEKPKEEPPRKSQMSRQEPHDKGDERQKRQPPGSANSSRANRRGKTASFVAEVGSAVVPLPTVGVAAGYYLMPDTMVEMSHARGRFGIFIASVSSRMTSVRWKQWWGNSFYTNLGLARRVTALEATLDPVTGSDEVSARIELTSLGADLQVGNRWQWDRFTLGCDWLGFFYPVSTSGSLEIGAAGAKHEEKDELKGLARRFGELFTVQGLRFYMGVAL